MEYLLTYYVKYENYPKYRYPHIIGKLDCPEGTYWCSISNYGYCKKNINNNRRIILYPPLHSKKFIFLYK